MIDFFHREQKTAPQPTNTPTPEAPPKPLNQLEKQVTEAPSVVVEAKKTEEQLRSEALHTMEIMEAARADKGNFCLTIGEGEKRALLLVAPIEGNVYKTVSPATKYSPESQHSFTYTDYVVLTGKGPRRVGFRTWIDSPLYVGSEKERGLADEKQSAGEFKSIINECIRTGKVHLKESKYVEEEIGVQKKMQLLLKKPGADPKENGIERKTLILTDRTSEFDHTKHVDIITDQTLTEKALSQSLKKVQAPIEAQIAATRGQITATAALRNGLK